jgi:hypothetical protein
MDFDDLTEEQRLSVVERLTHDAIDRLLDIKSIYDVTALQIAKLRENWREVEAGLHVNYPIRGSGVIATLGSSGVEGLEGEDFLITDEIISPDLVIGGLGQFPLEAATCAYVFTILENYGDCVVSLINPSYEEQRRAWHREVRAGSTLGSGKNAQKDIEGFCSPFEFDPSVVPPQPVLSLKKIKFERNSFAHNGKVTMRFEEFLRCSLEVICYIGLELNPDEEVLIVHRTEDFSERFSDAEEFRRILIQERDKKDD